MVGMEVPTPGENPTYLLERLQEAARLERQVGLHLSQQKHRLQEQ